MSTFCAILGITCIKFWCCFVSGIKKFRNVNGPTHKRKLNEPAVVNGFIDSSQDGIQTRGTNNHSTFVSNNDSTLSEHGNNIDRDESFSNDDLLPAKHANRSVILFAKRPIILMLCSLCVILQNSPCTSIFLH